VASLSVLVLVVLVISTDPAELNDPFGGGVMAACLFTCEALVVVAADGKKVGGRPRVKIGVRGGTDCGYFVC
jgi:hypothetical protein